MTLFTNQRLQKTEDRAKSNTHRIDGLARDVKELRKNQTAIQEIASSVKIMANDMSNMRSDITAISDNMNDMKDKQEQQDKRIDEVADAPMHEKAQKYDEQLKSQADLKKSLKKDIFSKIICIVVGGIVVYILTIIIPQVRW